ncbi:MAG: site-specific integrase [Chitinophagaceae bacterium]|nr:site-specific integrase [Chitinophagaceae bacterium]
MEQIKKILFSPPVLHKGKRWNLVVFATLPTGTTLRLKTCGGINRGNTTEEKEKKAAAFLKKFKPERDLFTGVNNDSYQAKLDYYIKQYIENHKYFWKPRTRDTYLPILRRFNKWCKKNKILVKLLSDDQANLFMSEAVGSLHRTTHNLYKTSLQTFYKTFRKRDNPFETVIKFAECKTPQRAFSNLELNRVLNYFHEKDPQLFLFAYFILFTFLRVEETRTLRVGDIDFNENIIRLRFENSKTNRNRFHALTPDILDHMDQIRKSALNFYVFGSNGEPGATMRGRNHFGELARKLLDECGFDSHYSLYSFRHTGAILLYKQCHDVRIVQQAMQHTNYGTTEKYLRN